MNLDKVWENLELNTTLFPGLMGCQGRWAGKQTTSPHPKNNNKCEQKENISLTRKVTHICIQPALSSHRVSRSLPSRQEGANILGSWPAQTRQRQKGHEVCCSHFKLPERVRREQHWWESVQAKLAPKGTQVRLSSSELCATDDADTVNSKQKSLRPTMCFRKIAERIIRKHNWMAGDYKCND